MKGYPGAKQYINIAYNEVTGGLCTSVYDGHDGFLRSCEGSVEDGRLTQSQLEEVYLYFCGQVYDTDFTNALASHFGCSTEDVYVKHSDVIKEFSDVYGNKKDIVNTLYNIADKYGVPKQTALTGFYWFL